MIVKNCSFEVLSTIINEYKKEYDSINLAFLLTHVPNPRNNRRISVLKTLSETTVIYSCRVNNKIFEPRQNIKHEILDISIPSSNNIFKRAWTSLDYQKKALEKLDKIRPNVIYSDGLDSLITAYRYKRKHNVRIIYEVHDLFVKKIVGQVEKMIFQVVDYLVVTSPRFYDIHYKNLITKDKVMFIPNSPELTAFEKYKKHQGKFTVGFIGAIRYFAELKMLVDAAGEVNCNVVFAGDSIHRSDYDQLKEYCKGRNYVNFIGRYDYDTQIADLYGMADCIYAVYDSNGLNERVALPNKLYESIICELPIIVSKNTYLSQIVEELGVGISISNDNRKELVSTLNKLQFDTQVYDELVKNCAKAKSMA